MKPALLQAAAAILFTVPVTRAWAAMPVLGRSAHAPVTITVETTDAPDLAPWAEKAKDICIDWYPKIEKILRSPNFTPPDTVTITFSPKYSGVAGTGGTHIMVNANYVRAHQDDFGMVVHELTHVVQHYHTYGFGWLVEGIADYVRFFKYEPKVGRPRINFTRATYHDAYRTSAAFLAWTEHQYDHKLVNKFNAALRAGDFSLDLFKQYTGKDPDALWTEFEDAVKGGKAKKFAVAV